MPASQPRWIDRLWFQWEAMSQNVVSSWQRHPVLSLVFCFSDFWNLSWMRIFYVLGHTLHTSPPWLVFLKAEFEFDCGKHWWKRMSVHCTPNSALIMKPFNDTCDGQEWLSASVVSVLGTSDGQHLWVVGRKDGLVWSVWADSLNCPRNTTTTKRNTRYFNLGNCKRWRSFFLSTWRDVSVDGWVT